MKEVIERLFDRMQSSTVAELSKMKDEMVAAAEKGPEGIQCYFEAIGRTLIQEAERLAGEVKSKLGA